MARFNPDTWKPSDDSSPEVAGLDLESVVLQVPFDENVLVMGCPCGCGLYPLGAKAVFRMGHDAKLRGVLIRAHLTDTPVRYVINGVLGDRYSAWDTSMAHEWSKYLDEAVQKREEANGELLTLAMASEKLVTVGKWERTGQVFATFATADPEKVEMKYVNKAGDIRTMRVAHIEENVS